MSYSMKHTIISAALALAPALSFAASPADLADAYFPASEVKLNPQEKASLEIAKRFDAGAGADIKPVALQDGSIQFAYGVTRPTVICAVLQVCDIELQAGEQVLSLQVGDTRFNLEPAITYLAGEEVQHVLVKATDVALDTSLVIMTDRRSYHMRLRSHRSEYMPRVVFSYPGEIQKQFEAKRAKVEAKRQEQTLPATGEYLGNLNFNYQVSGDAPWKPLRVYNDGQKTIIQVPAAIAQTEAPALMVLRGGGFFSDPEQVIVNYRLQGDRYIVDMVFDKAVLIAGVGGGQDSVTITRGK